MEHGFQQAGSLCGVRDPQVNKASVFAFQRGQTFFFQQHSVIDDSNVVGHQGNFRQDMAGEENGFSAFVAQPPDKGADLRDSDGVEPVGRFIQNEKLRVVHHRKGDRQPLLHAERILGKQLFIPIGKSNQVQGVFDRVTAGYAPQGGKDAQILRRRQIRIKTGGFNQAADPGQHFLFISPKGLSPEFDFPGRWFRQSQKHFHGRCLSGSVSSEQTVDPALFYMDIQVRNAFLRAVLFGKMSGFNDKFVHHASSVLLFLPVL